MYNCGIHLLDVYVSRKHLSFHIHLSFIYIVHKYTHVPVSTQHLVFFAKLLRLLQVWLLGLASLSLAFLLLLMLLWVRILVCIDLNSLAQPIAAVYTDLGFSGPDFVAVILLYIRLQVWTYLLFLLVPGSHCCNSCCSE